MKLKHFNDSVIKVNQTLSTNELMWEMLASKPYGNGFAIIAQSQTRGKGQKGNEWQVEPGKNLTCSILCQTQLNAQQVFYLNIISSLAIHHALSDFKIKASIKWPNDILVNKQKIAGILIENQIQGQTAQNTVIGIGINVNQQAFSMDRPITSMNNLLNTSVNIDKVFKTLHKHLDYYFDLLMQRKYMLLKKLYRKHLFQFGILAEYSSSKYGCFVGKIVEVDDGGLLMIQTIEGKELSFDMQTIRFL